MRLVAIGAGGFSKEVADLVAACGHELIGFVDEAYDGTHASTGLPVVRTLSAFSYDGAVLAIGDGDARARWFCRLNGATAIPTLVHPTAVVSTTAVLGSGCQVLQHVVINADAEIGDDCIINVAACVAHDCAVGAHSHIAPAVQMGGGSRVGEHCLIGTSATILPMVTVGRACTVGAGSVVVRDLADGVTAVGVPARVLGASPQARC